MKRYWKLFLVLLLLAISLSGCAIIYSAEPIAARVVDAETKQPIESVIVTANWQLEEGTMGGNVLVGQLMVMEAVTNKEGKFAFPSWGPKLAISSHLVNRDPQLLLFKSGYEYRELVNTFVTNYNKGSLRRSEWNGKTIEMKRFEGALKEYSSHLNSIKGALRFVEENCNWKKTPTILIALDKERQIFRAKGIDSGTYSIDYFDGLSDKELKECGSPSEFLKEQKR